MKKVVRKKVYGKIWVTINGKRMRPFQDTGIEIPYKIARNLEFKDVKDIYPICITYSEKNHNDPVLAPLINGNHCIEFVLEVINEMVVNVFVTVFDPEDLEEEKHEEYQFALEEVVKEMPELKLISSFEIDFEEADEIQKELDEANRKNGTSVKYSPVGYVQFEVDIPGFVFKDIYKHLTALMNKLDLEARKRMEN